MIPTSRLALSLVLALAIWLPTCLASMEGTVSVNAALVRYLVAFFVARIGVGFVGSLLVRYHEDNSTRNANTVTDGATSVDRGRDEALPA